MSGVDDLFAQARERAATKATPEDWGRRITELDEEESGFTGRWRGESVDEENGRPVYLFWDDDGARCFSRYYTSLGRELEQAVPNKGDRIVLFRGVDYTTKSGNSGFSYGVACEPSSDPIPDEGEATAPAEDDVPF